MAFFATLLLAMLSSGKRGVNTSVFCDSCRQHFNETCKWRYGVSEPLFCACQAKIISHQKGNRNQTAYIHVYGHNVPDTKILARAVQPQSGPAYSTNLILLF